MADTVFDDIARGDRRPARHNEGHFEFLNRTASRYFEPCRELIETWFAQVPPKHRAGLRGNLRSERHHRSAFWELYLHEAYRRSGFEVTIHPSVPGSRNHPDFLLEGDGQRFYLEAVTVGRTPPEAAEEARLATLHQLLAELLIEDFSIKLSTFAIGPNALPTRALRDRLKSWTASLDADAVSADLAASPNAAFDALPQLEWAALGWRLLFHAVPLETSARGTARSALGVYGPGEAALVDNLTGLRRVIETKRGKYGTLDAPLVIGVQSNTEYPTYDYQVEQALFGVATRRPPASAAGDGTILEEGLWIDRDGWKRSDIPQVISIYDLTPWSLTRSLPRCWSTLEPGVDLPRQPRWLAPMIIGDQATAGEAEPIQRHLGLIDEWPMAGNPDFDLT